MNKVVLMGNVGMDAELRTTQSGVSTLKFSLATNKKWSDKDGNSQERVEWHRCVMFDKRAEKLAQYITKGTKLVVEGEIRYGSYEKDGVKHYTTDIVVQNIEFAGGGTDKKTAAATPAADYPDSWDSPV